MSDGRPVVDGVREELRCPECGKYDSSLAGGANLSEMKALNAAADKLWKPKNENGVWGEHTLCKCYKRMTFNSHCPHCDDEIDDLMDFFHGSHTLANFECPSCGKWISGEIGFTFTLSQLREEPKD